MSYFENLHNALTIQNEESRKYGDGLAWDNKKSKTFKSQAPRGKVYWRLTNLERMQAFNKLKLCGEQLASLSQSL